MKKINNIAFCLIVLIMLLFPLCMTNTEEGAVSDADGRVLTTKPVLSEEGYQTDLEIWLKDRLGFRDKVASAHAEINDRLFNELISHTYQYGRDRYTFLKIHDNIEYCDYHETFVDMVANMQEYCESRGSKFYYVFNPEKESLYREYLPEGVNYSDEWADQMLKEMKARGVNVVDLRDALERDAKKHAVFNKTVGAGHWNQYGEFIGMRELLNCMRIDIPKLKVLDSREYSISSTDIRTSLSSSKAFVEETPVYTLKASTTDITSDIAPELKVDPSYSYYQLVKNNSENADGIERLLLFEDDISYPFAFSRARYTLAVSCLQNVIDYDYYYNIFKPDAVVFESMELVINDAFFSQAAIEKAERNPALIELFPESSFAERKASMLQNAANVELDATAVLVPGKTIDNIFISNVLPEARYAWMITDDTVIDLKRDDQGAFVASIKHGEIQDGNDIILCLQTPDGDWLKASILATSGMYNIAEVGEAATEHTSADKSGKNVIMTSSAADNIFSYSAIDLYSEDTTEYMASMGMTYVPGRTEGAYTHRLPTADYSLLLMAGGNSAVEWTSYKVHLENGRVYWFSYNLEELSAEKVVINDFCFLESEQR